MLRKNKRSMNLFDVYPLFDINIVKGKGCHVWDEQGQEYLDLYGGHAVISIGHAHPHYVEMISNQVATLGFYSNSVINKIQQQVAERLGRISGYEDYSLFLINSGAEANENALKLASFHNGRTRVLSAQKAFHGRTSLAVEVTANPNIIAPINANNHATYLPLNDLQAWVAEIEKGDVCAVIVECIQGVGGIRMVTPEFLEGLREACDRTDTVLICDEIQCGYGRSAKRKQPIRDPERKTDASQSTRLLEKPLTCTLLTHQTSSCLIICSVASAIMAIARTSQSTVTALKDFSKELLKIWSFRTT